MSNKVDCRKCKYYDGCKKQSQLAYGGNGQAEPRCEMKVGDYVQHKENDFLFGRVIQVERNWFFVDPHEGGGKEIPWSNESKIIFDKIDKVTYLEKVEKADLRNYEIGRERAIRRRREWMASRKARIAEENKK